MTHSLDTVLIATSLLPEGREVVRVGGALARATGARVAMVHGMAIPAWFGEAPLDSMGESGKSLQECYTALRQEIADEAGNAGIRETEMVGSFLETGPPHRVVIDLAHRLSADLILVGASDRRRGEGLGTTALRVMQKATRPVLVVREGFALPPRRILAAVDLSPLSGDILRCGFDRVAAMTGEHRPEIEALFVLSPAEREGWEHFEAGQVDRFAREELKRFVGRHGGVLGGKVRPRVRVGDARNEIVDEVQDFQTDLLLVGTHGRGGFERFVLGSVATDVVRRTHTSVLVVPPEAAARAAVEAEQQARRSADWTFVADEQPQPTREEARRTTETAT